MILPNHALVHMMGSITRLLGAPFFLTSIGLSFVHSRSLLSLMYPVPSSVHPYSLSGQGIHFKPETPVWNIRSSGSRQALSNRVLPSHLRRLSECVVHA